MTWVFISNGGNCRDCCTEHCREIRRLARAVELLNEETDDITRQLQIVHCPGPHYNGLRRKVPGDWRVADPPHHRVGGATVTS
jgi:hypothetical protein